MLAGYALFRCHVLNTTLRRHRLRDEGPTTNGEGCLWTQDTVTPHQFYAVPGNNMGKLIFRLPYVYVHLITGYADVTTTNADES
jgi:hypothetical protein